MVGQSRSELAVGMFAIFFTLPFIFLALAIAAVPMWRPSAEMIRVRRSHSDSDFVDVRSTRDAVLDPWGTDSLVHSTPSKEDPSSDTCLLASGRSPEHASSYCLTRLPVVRQLSSPSVPIRPRSFSTQSEA